MKVQTTTCASCVRFDYTTHKTEASHGVGMCTMPTGAPQVSPFVPHDAISCVLYTRDTNLAARRAFVQQHTKVAEHIQRESA